MGNNHIMMKKKKIFKLIFILTIVVFFIIILYFINNIKNNTYEDDYYNYGTPIYINETDEKIYPQNIYTVVYKYKGKADLTKLYNNIYLFKEYIEELSAVVKNLDSEELLTYYDSNMLSIKKYTGITDIETFKKLVENVKKINEDSVFEKAEAVIETLKNDNEKLSCQINMIYTSGTTLKFIINISNEDVSEDIFSYVPVI